MLLCLLDGIWYMVLYVFECGEILGLGFGVCGWVERVGVLVRFLWWWLCCCCWNWVIGGGFGGVELRLVLFGCVFGVWVVGNWCIWDGNVIVLGLVGVVEWGCFCGGVRRWMVCVVGGWCDILLWDCGIVFWYVVVVIYVYWCIFWNFFNYDFDEEFVVVYNFVV